MLRQKQWIENFRYQALVVASLLAQSGPVKLLTGNYCPPLPLFPMGMCYNRPSTHDNDKARFFHRDGGSTSYGHKDWG